MDKLVDYSWFPEEATPILDCLAALRDVKDKCFGWDLEEGWEQAISNFTSMYAELQEYATATLNLQLNITWKIHIIACHLKPFCDKVILLIIFILNNYLLQFQCGLARYAEQVGESIHAKMKPVLLRHKRKAGHKDHGNRQQRAVVEFSSNNC